MKNRDYQEGVDAYFDTRSLAWEEIYSARTVQGMIYQQRMASMLEWIDDLALPRGSRVLEIGSGAGLTTIELASRGYVVDAIDSSEAMVERTLLGVTGSDVGSQVKVFRGDAEALPFEDNQFALVVALGVIPWLESPDTAIREMTRVAKPGGYVILTSDNYMRLNHFVDPRRSPVLTPLWRFLKRALERARLREPRTGSALVHMYTTSYIDRIFSQNQLEIEKARTLGFGPFLFFGHKLLPDSIGVRVHHRLQTLADRGVTGLRSTGSQYMLLARNPGASSYPPTHDPA